MAEIKNYKLNMDNLYTRFGNGKTNPIVSFLMFAFFVLSPVMLFMGFSEEAYIIDTARDSTKAVCDVYNTGRNVAYIKESNNPTGNTGARLDGVTKKICEGAGCSWRPGTDGQADFQGCQGASGTGACGVTANGIFFQGDYHNLGFSEIAGLGATYQDCRDKADYDRGYNMAYLTLTMIFVGWFFFHTLVHKLLFGDTVYEQDIIFNNHALLSFVEFLAVLLPLPLLALTRVMPEHSDKHLRLDQNPVAYIFMGWLFLIAYLSTHAAVHSNEFGIMSAAIGSSADGASGKVKSGKNRKVTSIHW